jgi:hypothetical protein
VDTVTLATAVLLAAGDVREDTVEETTEPETVDCARAYCSKNGRATSDLAEGRMVSSVRGDDLDGANPVNVGNGDFYTEHLIVSESGHQPISRLLEELS